MFKHVEFISIIVKKLALFCAYASAADALAALAATAFTSG